ncbi:hypothetical protein MKK50_18150 [Methylobacterium sp. J-043]|uniref:Uncharacterized protein n=1 Tax=Methylorubrum populi TaxID=223967 RepID=A0A833J7Z5_9HYPH|nr:hypothetical protein [Methylorubrum populi]KAB7786019.1 hypothetical protein F8B43_1420 [Methylorubrum populi]MCJ2031291.1 hypothetical protein [Methylobacterium sp. J-043]
MLADEQDRLAPDAENEETVVRVKMPDPARAGVVDVISMRGLMRAVNLLRGHGDRGDLDSAIARTINMNGAIAKVLQGERS